MVSELARPRPSAAVLRWFDSVPEDTLHLSVLTLGELRKGVERLAPGGRRDRLRAWLEHELPEWFGARLLAIDAPVADRWGRLLALARRPLPAIDSLLAAAALHHDLTLVTRNTADFGFDGLTVIDPWKHLA